jgi:hypothetical protein
MLIRRLRRSVMHVRRCDCETFEKIDVQLAIWVKLIPEFCRAYFVYTLHMHTFDESYLTLRPESLPKSNRANSRSPVVVDE